MPGMMKAAVIREPGGPEVLKIEHMWLPAAKPGSVLIQIRAFGLNWPELFTGVCRRMSNFRAFSASRRSGLWGTRPADPSTIGQDAAAVGCARRRAGDAADLMGRFSARYVCKTVKDV